MAGNHEHLFEIPEITPADRHPETVDTEKASSIARIFHAAGYVAAMESATASFSDEDWVIKEVVANQLTHDWLKSGGDDLLTSAGYQVFYDGFVIRTLSNYEFPPETSIDNGDPRWLLENPPLRDINDLQAHPRITFDELRERVNDAIAGLNSSSQIQ